MLRSLAPWLLAVALPLAGCASHKVFDPPYCPVRADAAAPAASVASGPLHRTALAYDSFFQEKLRPQPYGGLVNVTLQDGSPVSYDDQLDSAIWTGTYLAAEAFRYASTRDQEALENAKGAARTLDLFLKVTGQGKLLARFAGPLDQTDIYLTKKWNPKKRKSNACKDARDQAQVCCLENECLVSETDEKLFWIAGTSRDQYTGWFFGMGIAHWLIDDPDLRRMIEDDVRTVITKLREDDWIIRAPEQGLTSGIVEPMQRLTWLLIAADVLGPEACGWYEEAVREVWPVLADSIENDFNETNKYMQYYGFNLAFLNFYNLVRLEPNPDRRKVYLDSLMGHAYRYVEGTDNAFFDYIAQAVGGTVPSGTLDGDREALRQFPSEPTRAICVFPPESKLSKASLDLHRLDKKIHPQAENPYPLSYRCQQDFLWQQTPYAICCCEVPTDQQWTEYQSVCDGMNPPSGNLYFPRADYLVAYWMGRYYGFLEPGQ